MAQSHHWIDFGSAPRGDIARRQGDTKQSQADGGEGNGIGSRYAEEKSGDHPGETESQRHSDSYSRTGKLKAKAGH